jgi:hypothetical protein
MNKPSISHPTNHRFAEAVRDYAPSAPRKWQKLLTLQPGIAELRRKGASYQTIADILRAAEVPVSPTTVARFCRDRLPPARPRKPHQPASRNLLSPPPRTSGPPVNTGGPRIADPRTI